MREPPLGLEEVPHPALAQFFDEVRAAPTTAELLVGLYEKALPALDAALAQHVADTHPVADAPSVRVIRTTCWGSDPNRSSAAANSRSTIIVAPRTR